MEDLDYSRFILAFAFVIGLIWAVAALAKRFGLDQKMRGVTGEKGRLAIREVLYLDPKRKVLLLKADTKEYLIFVAGDQAQLIDRLEENAHATS